MTPIDAISFQVSTLPDSQSAAGELYAGATAPPQRARRSFASVLREQELREAGEHQRAEAEAWRQAVLSDAIRGHGGSPVAGGSSEQELALARLLAGMGDAAPARIAYAQSGYHVASRGMERTGRQLEQLSLALAGAGI